MTQQQLQVDQHFVPAFYLRRFADARGQLQVLDLKRRRMLKPRAPRSVCYRPFFYAAETGVYDEFSQWFEKELGRLETALAPLVSEHEARALAGTLTDVDFAELAALVSLLWIRTLEFRETQMFGNGSHLQFMMDHYYGCRNLFFAHRWRVWRRSATASFITSGNPVADVPRPGPFGGGFLQRNKYLALTPNVLFEGVTPTEETTPSVTAAYLDATDQQVRSLNMRLSAYSDGYCYGQSREELQDILAVVLDYGARQAR